MKSQIFDNQIHRVSVCTGSLEPNEIFIENPNFSNWIYIISGSCIEKIDNQSINCTEGNIYDLSSYLKKSITHIAGDAGMSWFCINPYDNAKSNVQLVKIEDSNQEQNLNINTDSYIFTCIEGITINGIATKKDNIIKVSAGKVLNFAGQIGGTCIIYTLIN